MGWKIGGLILVGMIAALWLIKAPLISSYLTKKLGIEISLRTVDVRPKYMKMGHFRIANPEGFKDKTALSVDTTTVDYRWEALPQEIDLITLDRVFLNIDIRTSDTSDNNWTALGAEMPKVRDQQRVVVHKLIVNDLTVKTDGKGARGLGIDGVKHLARLEFNEIDSEEGFPTKELISQIFQGAGLKIFIQKFVNPVMQIQKALSPLKLFGEKEKPSSGEPEGLRN